MPVTLAPADLASHSDNASSSNLGGGAVLLNLSSVQHLGVAPAGLHMRTALGEDDRLQVSGDRRRGDYDACPSQIPADSQAQVDQLAAAVAVKLD